MNWPVLHGFVIALLCLPLGDLRVLCGEPLPLRLTKDGSFKQNLQWSPDGKTLLFTRIHEGKMSLWTMPAGGGDLKRLLPNAMKAGVRFLGHVDGAGRLILLAGGHPGPVWGWAGESAAPVLLFDRLESAGATASARLSVP